MKVSEIWDALRRLKALLEERQVLEEMRSLLHLIVSIISKLMTKDELKERLRQSSELLVNYLYADTSKFPADTVSPVVSKKADNGRIGVPWK